MFEYCSSRHINEDYQFVGTVDCALLNEESGMLLLYSIVNMGGQWMQLQVMQPVSFEELNRVNPIKGKTLKGMFLAAEKEKKDMKVKTKCVRTEKETLLALVRKDAASLTPADLASLETIIAEVFA